MGKGTITNQLRQIKTILDRVQNLSPTSSEIRDLKQDAARAFREMDTLIRKVRRAYDAADRVNADL